MGVCGGALTPCAGKHVLGGCSPSIYGGHPSLLACTIVCLSSLAFDGCLVTLLLVSLPQLFSRSLIKSSHLLPGLRDHGPLSWTSSFLHLAFFPPWRIPPLTGRWRPSFGSLDVSP
ncbi:Uridine kinase [Zea mays]|uniref:Uridine kinase n=1 Tax=Zea mays TaxID=4577 RepID=A0A1D6ESS1_MAIZE|nr:Uridine kinase [Zea mays]